MRILAELLDSLKVQGRAFLTESEHVVIASSLSVEDATRVRGACEAIGWQHSTWDSSNNLWPNTDKLDQAYAPFRIDISKPASSVATLHILTNTGFRSWLAKGSELNHWKISRLEKAIITQRFAFTPWNENPEFSITAPTKSPRALVREYSRSGIVPGDIRPWLLVSENIIIENEATRIFVNAAIQQILRSLPDEIDPESNSLKFVGPPRYEFSDPEHDGDHIAILGREDFFKLQEAARWIFENEREAEMRHHLVGAEIARCANFGTSLVHCIKGNITHVLDGAKIAYQLGLSELSRNTLLALSDLRKSVADETSRLTESTRQLAASVSGALALGVGLIAARISTNTSEVIITSVMIVVDFYVAAVIYTGWRFVALQVQLRKNWQPHLFRFLPTADYEKMVLTPAKKAENSFFLIAIGGALATMALTIAVIIVAYSTAYVSSGKVSDYNDEQSSLDWVGSKI